jgi:prolipoprotein diacylglyceryl transferase
MIDLVIHWNVDPEAFSIGPITLRWYGLLWVFAFFASYHAFKELLRFDKLSEDYEWQALTYMIFGTLIGARLGHCFFYQPMDYLQNPLEIFATWRGGLSSHGGAFGILAALYLFSRKTKKPYIWTLDRVVIVVGVAGFFIRMGNLMNSEIYGHATTLPWGFVFERNRETLPKHPTQIYEALYYALTYFVLRFVYRKCNSSPRPFLIFGLFLIMVFGFRFCIEFIKNPQEDFEMDMMFNMGQLLSTPFIVMGIISLIISRRQGNTELLPQAENVSKQKSVKPTLPTSTRQYRQSSIKSKRKK